MFDLIRWFEDRNSYEKSFFSRNKRYPGVLYDTKTGNIFYCDGKTLEELNSIQPTLFEIYHNFEDGDYHISEIISYYRENKLKEIGI